jgi:hypothetical protein
MQRVTTKSNTSSADGWVRLGFRYLLDELRLQRRSAIEETQFLHVAGGSESGCERAQATAGALPVLPVFLELVSDSLERGHNDRQRAAQRGGGRREEGEEEEEGGGRRGTRGGRCGRRGGGGGGRREGLEEHTSFCTKPIQSLALFSIVDAFHGVSDRIAAAKLRCLPF